MGIGQNQHRLFTIEQSWIDSIDIIVKNRNTNVMKHYHVGDKVPFSERPKKTRYFQVEFDLAPGITDVMVYAKTADSMVLPFYLVTAQQQQQKELLLQYGYGLVYGYLLALLFYNAILFLGLRDIRYILYSGLLGSFVAGNIAYTGHGFMWLWPNFVAFQQWGQALFMILYASFGLLFALYFLEIKSLSKRLFIGIVAIIAVINFIYVYTALSDKPTASTVLSFVFVSSYMLVALGLGFYALYNRQPNAIYFLSAIGLGSVGVGITSIAAWGGMPFNLITFHAAELGMIAEATLLALALSFHFRTVQVQGFLAEKMAGIDPLTQLNNRRGFMTSLDKIWKTICRHNTPASVVIIDLDNFKNLNDTYGHEVGDVALKNVAHRLSQHIRSGDIVARWGGEEFLLFLPETSLEEAFHLAERLRLSISQDSIETQLGDISVTASLGIAQRIRHHTEIEPLIDNADKALYEAKRSGKNCSVIFEQLVTWSAAEQTSS
ncbi:MAG: sensor domain-containing diguanylate cyclase [Gammaproteobacteria bacterium]|nr:sensor domain-containing diguanylate cyclase [Gammaproteobacteria bacterium]